MREPRVPFIDPSPYMPHGHCYFWETPLVLTHVTSDVVIALSYLAISTTLVVLVRRARGGIPFRWIVLAFGLFIVACGFTHLMEVWTLYEGHYWISGSVKVVTAAASIATAIVFPLNLPNILATLRAARETEHHQRDLETAHFSLQKLIEELKQSERSRSETFANVSHELRTPLSLILGPSKELLDDPEIAPQHRATLTTIIRNARILHEHVDGLLLVAKGETVDPKPRYATVDVERLVQRVASNFDVIGTDRKVTLSVRTEPCVAEVDPSAIQRVLINLLDNAFRFTPSGGTIRVTLDGDTDTVRFVIADSGSGIPPDQRDAVFERFHQLDPSSAQGGFGLGLAIVRSLVAMHRGTIVIEEAPEGGALFRAELPRKAPHGERVDRRSESMADDVQQQSRPPEDTITGEDRPRVLIVEDNHEMSRFIATVLESSFDTHHAVDAAQGVKRALEDPPDLVITDVMMPGMRVDELVRSLRAAPECANVPLLVLSAREDADRRADLLRAGVLDYVTKPFEPNELRARVDNLVAQKRARDVLSAELSDRDRGLAALARDLTNQRRALQTALEETSVAKRLAEQAAQMKTNLLRMIAHELRTPVSAIQLQLQLFSRSGPELDGERSVVYERIWGTVRRLISLIESVLQYARIDGNRFELAVTSFSVSEVVQEVGEEQAPLAAHKNLELVMETPHLPSLHSDATLLRLIATNLISNALKFTTQGGVYVRTEHADDRWILEVRDTGPGIPEGMEREVFEPFTQAGDVLYQAGPGSGLGLALVKEMVLALGGEITLVSDGGATFRVSIPSVEDEEQNKKSD